MFGRAGLIEVDFGKLDSLVEYHAAGFVTQSDVVSFDVDDLTVGHSTRGVGIARWHQLGLEAGLAPVLYMRTVLPVEAHCLGETLHLMLGEVLGAGISEELCLIFPESPQSRQFERFRERQLGSQHS